MVKKSSTSVFVSFGLKIGGMAIFTLLLSVFPVLPGQAATPVPAFLAKEAYIQKLQSSIRSDGGNRAKLQKAVQLLETALHHSPNDPQILLTLAEADYRLADPEAKIDKTFPLYEKTGRYAHKALEIEPKRVAGHYWHGLYLLKKAQKEGGLGAFFTVRDGIKELNKVRRELPAYDHGGASRVLGLLYCLAPGWSPFGDLNKSIALEKEAIRIAPGFLLNRLYLARAYKKKGDMKAAVEQCRQILAATPQAPNVKANLRYQQEARKMLADLGQPVETAQVLPH